jgi:hypothetical protein
MDRDTIIFTYNILDSNGTFLNAQVHTQPKVFPYNGRIEGARFFQGGSCTIAPPYVLDGAGIDYLLSFCPGDNKVTIGSITNSSRDNVAVNFSDNSVVVAHFGIPPDATQPGTSYTLDTGDNRFENRSLQVGNRIINTATVNVAGIPTAVFYNFNISASPHTEVAESLIFASRNSRDWHPSIVANTVAAPAGTALGEVFVTWMSTDTTTNVQLRTAGWIGDNPGPGVNGIPVFTSPLPLNQSD